LGLVISHWNVDTNDWRFKGLNAIAATNKSMEEVNNVILNGHSNPATDSFILLQHEIHEFSVVNLAERVMNSILAAGYRFVTMDECVGKPAYLPGSTIPSTVPPTTTTTGGVVAPTTSVVAPSSTVSVSVRPSGSSAPVSSPSGKPNSAGIVKAGAWAMGLAAVVGYALL
ncbi:hypothetical protein BGZ65_006627, partial [Modicella reniformis]